MKIFWTTDHTMKISRVQNNTGPDLLSLYGQKSKNLKHWDILKNIFFCVPPKKETASVNNARAFIFGWTFLNVSGLGPVIKPGVSG